MLNGKSVLITGGTGSFGKKFVETILGRYPSVRRIVVYSRDELKQFELKQKYPHDRYPQLRFFIGDVRDGERLKRACEGVDVIIHAAAIKQVDTAEYNPEECIKTNIHGAQNVINAALQTGVKHVVALSTDKACAPINLYGATKLTSDKLFTAANNISGSKDIKFSVVRYGNVMGSRGSVIPFFIHKRDNGVKELPITDMRMTRFNISLQAGVDLVMYAIGHHLGGEIFIPKIPSYHIVDVAKAIAPNIPLVEVGIRPGEKLHEEMITVTDALNTIDLGQYYAILPSVSFKHQREEYLQHHQAVPVPQGFHYSSDQNEEWETVETLDFGFDITALNGRLQSTFDWYRRDTKDMLAPGAELPSVVGASAPLQNTADLRTKGWELSLTWRDRIGAWGYNVGFNLYDSKTVVTKYHNESKIILKSDGTNNYYEGYEIGSIWGYVTDGYYTADDFEDTNTWKLKEGVVTVDGVSPRPGDIKYQNLRDDGSSTNRIDTGDGTFDNPGDRKIIGNNSLRLQYGINLGVNYKGFDLSVLLQGVGKRDVWISDARRWPFNSGQFGSLFKDQLDYWKPVDSANGDWTAANPNAEYFRIYGQGNNSSYNTRAQTKYLMNGSYLRVKNVTLSYNFPKSWLAPITLTSLKAFVSCENLHTFTKLMKGYDPERLSWGYPFYRTISFGFNVTL